MQNNYLSSEWQSILEHNRLSDFDAIWPLELKTLGKGNYGRGGHSLVSRYDLHLPQGDTQTVYIKRQENYTCFAWYLPFFKVATLQREFNSSKRCQQIGVGSYEVIYFAAQGQGKKYQSILITKALPAVSLDEWLLNAPKQENYHVALRRQVIQAAAQCIRRLHAAGFCHGNLLAGHIFLQMTPQIQSALIDLEGMKPLYWNRKRRQMYDLAKLFKFFPKTSSKKDKLQFLKAYLHSEKLTPAVKKLWKSVMNTYVR